MLFREGHLVEEALLGKMEATGSPAFLRQPHLARVCERLRRDYPRLAEGMDAALLLELGDDYSPRALGLRELVEVLVSWQWCVIHHFCGGGLRAAGGVRAGEAFPSTFSPMNSHIAGGS